MALARKLAVMMHRMLADGTRFIADKAAAAAPINRKEITGSGGSRHRPPAARSRRWDDGSGQADDISAAALLLRVVRLADLLLIRPHQVAARRRPRTEERPRRQDQAQRD